MSLRTLFLTCALGAILAWSGSVEAGSLGDWFKKLGNSMAHPRKHASPTRTRGEKEKATNAAMTPSVTPTPVPAATPEPTVRTASVVTVASPPKRDIPYGIPVADKPGFVTSPYAPNQGLVDVRGIPSGAEVKDPYTGKSFLTP